MHADELIIVYNYMVTKVFNIQPILFHQYLCHILWFKKQSFTLVWKTNPPLQRSVCVHLRVHADEVSIGSTHEALVLKVCLFMWSVKSDSCYNVPWLCSARCMKQTMHSHKCDHVKFLLALKKWLKSRALSSEIFFLGGGGDN